MGNHDQGIGFATGDCSRVHKTDEQRAEGAASLAWTDAAASDETRAFLGSLRRINEYLFEDRPEHAMARMAEENPYRAILFGHTHLPHAREVERHGGGSTLFVNVGSGGRRYWRVTNAPVPAAVAAGVGEAGCDPLVDRRLLGDH